MQRIQNILCGDCGMRKFNAKPPYHFFATIWVLVTTLTDLRLETS